MAPEERPLRLTSNLHVHTHTCTCTHTSMQKHLHIETHMGGVPDSLGLHVNVCDMQWLANWRQCACWRYRKVPGFPCLGWVTAYRGVGLRSASFSCSFRASQWGWELTEAPGAAEVGAQGMGRSAGLPENEAREEVSKAEPRLAMVNTAHLLHARLREDLSTGYQIWTFMEPMPQNGRDYRPVVEQNHNKVEGKRRNVLWTQSTTEVPLCLVYRCFPGKVGFELQTQDMRVTNRYSWEGRCAKVRRQDHDRI